MSKAKNATTHSTAGSISALYAGSISVTLFWMLVLLKKAYGSLGDALRWNDAIGPLSGTFGVGLIVLVASYFAINKFLDGSSTAMLKKHEQMALRTFMVASILVFMMTFPPVFEPIAELLHG